MRRAALALVAVALAAPASAGSWKLVPAESWLSFVGIKNDSVGIAGVFTALEGAFDDEQRSGWIEVKLASTSTGDPARDENVRTHFFEVAKFPVARFEVSGLPAADALPGKGESAPLELAGTLQIHGTSLPLRIGAKVFRDSRDHLHVRNAKPLVLSAHDLGMEAQVAELKAVCGHQALSAAVPVEFDVVFAP